MSDPRPTRDRMSLEEATVSNMWEITAHGGVLIHLVFLVYLAYLVCLVR
jgi:hypothetical protein